MQATLLGDALFTRTQQKVLGLLFGQPERSFYLNEIVRLAGIGKGTIKRELERMQACGLLTVERIGNQTHYRANKDGPVFNELRSIVQKAVHEPVLVNPNTKVKAGTAKRKDRLVIGDIKVSRADLRKLAKRFRIHRLYLFGSAARGELKADSDIDLLVEFETGNVPSVGSMVDIQDAFAKLFHGRKVNVVTPSILNNPYRKRTIEKDMEELYAA